jgi:parallel beta-helix repeat protein
VREKMKMRTIAMFACFFLIVGAWMFAPLDVAAEDDTVKGFFKGMKDEKKGDEVVPAESTDYETDRDSDPISGYDPRIDSLLRDRFPMYVIYVNNRHIYINGDEGDGTWEKPYTTITEALDALEDPNKQVIFVVETNVPYGGFTVSEDFTKICGQGYDIPDIGLPYGLPVAYPLIDGPVTIDASNVEIAGFSFNNRSQMGTCITIVSGDCTFVHDNSFLIEGSHCRGIYIVGGTNGMISGNIFSGSRVGISDSISGNNTIFKNEFNMIGARSGAIIFSSDSSGLRIRENTIHSRGFGIGAGTFDSLGTSDSRPLIKGNEIIVDGTGLGSDVTGINLTAWDGLNVDIFSNTILVIGDDDILGIGMISDKPEGGGLVGTDDVPVTIEWNTITVDSPQNSLEPRSVGIRIDSTGDTFAEIKGNYLSVEGWAATGIDMGGEDLLDTNISENNFIYVDAIYEASGINLYGRAVKGIVDGNSFFVHGNTNLYLVRVGEEFNGLPAEGDTIGTPEEPFYITNNSGFCSDRPNISEQRNHHGISLCTIHPGAGNTVIWSGTSFIPLGSDWTLCDHHHCYDAPNCTSYGGGMVKTNFVGEDSVYPDTPQP